jgi:Flp pilus assembly protein TadD
MPALAKALLAPLLLALALPAAAQHLTPRPRLAIAAPAEQPVVLQAVRVTSDLGAGLALTSVELTFYNPNRRILEGELQFPLLDGQTVVGMAMEIDGKLREAVPVEKARGQMVFEDVTRARIDPALLEATRGDHYKLRVYPILPERTKTVVVRYAESLGTAGGRRTYRLPLEYGERVPSFSLRVVAHGAEARPAVVRGPALAFGRDGDRWLARMERSDFVGRGWIELAAPAAGGPQVVTQQFDGRRYFYAEVPVAAGAAPRTPPGVVGIVWDASGSGAARHRAREFALLDAYFARLRDAEVRLVVVRERAAAPERFVVADGDWSALRRALESVAYDGATNLAAFVPEAGVGEYLLFGDGLDTFGDAPLPQGGVPVYAIAAAVRTDAARLRQIAHASGGRFIDLNVAGPRAAAAALLATGTRLVGLSGEGVTDLVAASPFPEQGRLRVAGVLAEPSGTLQLTLIRNGARETRRIAITERGDGPFAAAQWARLRIAALEGEYERNKAAIRRLGKAFGLVTRETSLIVLDRVEDYARFEIVPPPELAAEYQRLVGVLAQRKRQHETAQLERVVAMLREKEAWWQREFPKGTRPAPQRSLAPQALRDEAAREGRMDAARQAPSALAARPAAPAPSARAAEATAKTAADAVAPGAIAIQLRRWTPDAPYIARLREASADELYRVYLDERPDYAASTAFFLDAADQLFERGLRELGVRVLTNLAEMDLENRHVLRILGYRLMQAGEAPLALPVFRRVLALAPEEPQSYRDLGLAYAATGEPQKAVDLLYEVVARPWHGRFPEIELIAAAELNALVATAAAPLDTSRFDPRILRNLPVDLRVVLTWDADNTDIDLWVTDPSGERAYYGNPLTWQGGRMSRDFTGGYGPEEFSLRRAQPGKYRIEANFYGHRQQIVAGATTLQVKLQTRFGTRQVEEQIVTLRLQSRGGMVAVGEFEVAAAIAE